MVSSQQQKPWDRKKELKLNSKEALSTWARGHLLPPEIHSLQLLPMPSLSFTTPHPSIRCRIHQWPPLHICLGYEFILFTISYRVLAERDDKCSHAFLSSWRIHSQKCPKCLTLDSSISKETICCLVSEVKGKNVLLLKYHPIKYEQWHLSWACLCFHLIYFVTSFVNGFPKCELPSQPFTEDVCLLFAIMTPSFPVFQKLD